MIEFAAMGNLSDNFSNKDFTCKCPACRGGGEYKLHLGLVGILEMLASHFKKAPKVIVGFRCEESTEKLVGRKRSIHNMGKAAHIIIDGVSLAEIYNFAREIPEIGGIGIYPSENFIHLDTRAGDRAEWVKEGETYSPLTLEKKKQYGLG